MVLGWYEQEGAGKTTPSTNYSSSSTNNPKDLSNNMTGNTAVLPVRVGYQVCHEAGHRAGSEGCVEYPCHSLS